jgi:hypothetical protein
MIFLGDIASPDRVTTEQLNRVFFENTAIFNGRTLICNFEGLISDKKLPAVNQPILYNHPSVPGILNRGVPPVLCLANNHVLDLPERFDETIDVFKQEGIAYCGAGKSKEEALKPISVNENNRKNILYNACWDFLLYNHANPSKGIYVSKIDENELIKAVGIQKETNPDAAILIFLHWSFDLETIPFPMVRQFSKALIDSGASIIVGAHSHCVQGGEKYKDGYIVYGLGNFFIPNSTFAGSYLKFPDFSKIQLALEWNSHSNKATCHWFEYQHIDNGHTLKYISSEKFEESHMLSIYTPYANMNDGDYLNYYKKNRRKRFLIPVYKDFKKVLLNQSYTVLLKFRAHIVRFLAKIKLRSWQN